MPWSRTTGRPPLAAPPERATTGRRGPSGVRTSKPRQGSRHPNPTLASEAEPSPAAAGACTCGSPSRPRSCMTAAVCRGRSRRTQPPVPSAAGVEARKVAQRWQHGRVARPLPLVPCTFRPRWRPRRRWPRRKSTSARPHLRVPVGRRGAHLTPAVSAPGHPRERHTRTAHSLATEPFRAPAVASVSRPRGQHAGDELAEGAVSEVRAELAVHVGSRLLYCC